MAVSNKHLVLINEYNKSLMRELKDSNILFYAELKDWYASDAFRSFSIKYVLDGCITYRIGRVLHSVKSNQVLVGNKQPNVTSYFESRNLVKSICVNINMKSLAEAHALLTEKNDFDPDKLLSGNAIQPNFQERIYTLTYNSFLAPLSNISRMILGKRDDLAINEEFFLDFSEKIVLQLFTDNRIYDKLDFIRVSTKKEILRRLDIARNYLQENYLQRPTVKELAIICNMSEFHFFRAFRQAFNITPYQFQLKLRLEKAKHLISGSNISFTEISKECSFPDSSTFCKAFKRMYCTSPSAMRKSFTGIESKLLSN